MMFTRFAQRVKHPTTGRLNGFFDAAYDTRNSELIDFHTREQCHILITWFAENLPKPTRLSRSRSKGASRRNAMGLSWFKPTAKLHIEKAYELAALLAEVDVAIEVIRTDRPGFIVYQDEFQIVAEPFADTPC